MKATETRTSTTAAHSAHGPFHRGNGASAFFGSEGPAVQRRAAFESDEVAPEAVRRKPAFESDDHEHGIRRRPIHHGPARPFFGPTVQMRVKVGPTNDAFEREAEQMADYATSPGARGAAPAAPDDAAPPSPYQRKGVDEAAPPDDLDARLQETKGAGHPIASNVRVPMERAFGADFRGVRIHTDARAVRLSKELGAQAFTHGSDVYFNEGQYRPDSASGRHLLAHELTHTVQQGAVVRKRNITRTSEPTVQRGVIGRLINRVLRHVPGWTLLTVIIGKNPATGDAVPRTPANILGGILGLLPGGTLLADKLRETGALEEAGNWIASEIDKLGFSWSYIKNLFSRAWDAVSIWNGISRNIELVAEIFSEPYHRIKAFAGKVWDKIKEFILRGALKLVGAPVDLVMGVINKVVTVFKLILSNPIGFVRNLMSAVGGGLKLFVKNIKRHLLERLIDWLTGALSSVPIKLPTRLDLRGIIHVGLQVLGLTWARIRTALVKRLGERVVNVAEQTVDIVRRVVREGPMALWEIIQEKAGAVKTTIINGIRDWAITQVVKQAVAQIALMLNPAGAIIQAALGLFNLVVFLHQNISRIAAFVSTVFDSISDIARGAVAGASKKVESALGQTIPLVLNFLARLLRLGDIGKAVTGVIKRIRKPIDRAIDAVIAKLTALAKSLVKKGGEILGRIVKWVGFRKPFKDKNNEDHELYFQGKPPGVQMIVASKTPRQVKDLLNNHPDKGSRAWNSASSAFEKLADAQDHLVKLDEKYAVARQQNERQTLMAQINAKVEALRPLVAVLSDRLAELGITGDIAETEVSHVVANAGKSPTEVSADTLTALPGNTRGDPNAAAAGDIPGWAYLRNVNNARPEAKVFDNYVRMHLVHHQLHGPATHANLVPATKDANNTFYRKMEFGLVRLIHKPGALLWLKLQVAYHSGAPEFLSKIRAEWGHLKKDKATGKKTKDPTKEKGSAEVTSDAPPAVTGKITIRLHGKGRSNLQNEFNIPELVARRVADALKAYPENTVYQAIDAHYPNAGNFLGRTPWDAYRETDKQHLRIAIKQKRAAGFVVILTPQ